MTYIILYIIFINKYKLIFLNIIKAVIIQNLYNCTIIEVKAENIIIVITMIEDDCSGYYIITSREEIPNKKLIGIVYIVNTFLCSVCKCYKCIFCHTYITVT